MSNEEERQVVIIEIPKEIIIWLYLFGEISPKDATCEDCLEYKKKFCRGGKEPTECVIEKSKDLKWLDRHFTKQQ
jgi:hypothetical protein